MVLCKFFLQGNCRFGENCKFEHQLNQLNDGRQQQHGSIIRQQHFGTNSGNTNIDTNTLIRAVTNDMLAAEKGGQWLLSCYAPFKEKPNYPGFEEQSFEEVRWGYYEAQHSGTVDQYRQQLQMALQASAMKIRSLQNPSPDAVNTIKTIYNSAPQNASNVFGNAGGFNNQNANTFGQSNFGNAGVFAQNNQQQSTATQSIFANANQKLFGGMQQQNSAQSRIAAPNQKVFGGMQQPSSTSIFGNNQPGNVNSQNIFANASQGNNFGTAASPFGQPYANPFGAQPNQQAPPPFGAQPNQQAPPPFGSQPNQQAPPQFGAQPNQQAPPSFATQPTQQASPQFGTQPNQQAPPRFVLQQPPPVGFGGQQFGAQQNTPPFGMQQQSNSPLALGPQQNAPLPFNTQQQTENVAFPANQQFASPFAAPNPNINTPFNVQQQQFGPTQEVPAGAFGQPSTIFGGSTNSNSSFSSQSFASSNTVLGGEMGGIKDESVYSRLEDLSESDIKAYESDNFEFGKIPEKPPTIQMCF